MKRLLLPLLAALALPTAVIAFPFGKNLEFRNDIGTKTLIKGNAVYSEYLTVEDLKAAVENYKRDAMELYSKKMSYEREELSTAKKNYGHFSTGGILEKSKLAPKQLPYWENEIRNHQNQIKNLKKIYLDRVNVADTYLEDLNEEQLIKIQAVNLSFKPVLIDLNNNQTIQSEVKLTCFNPQLSKEKKDIWLNYYRYHGGESERELAICKKYAKYK